MTTSVSDFPPELITQILLRLTVKLLLKFRRVCREWRNIIDSKNFVNMHLTQNEKNPDCLIIDSGWGSCVLYFVDFKSYKEAVKVDVRPWWPNDTKYDYTRVNVWNSCNGLLCCNFCWKDIALWNPSTKKHWMLPPLNLDADLQLADEDSSCYVSLAFGFDSAVGGYKVVSILRYYSECSTHLGTEVKVFSLRSNLWQRVYGLPEKLSHVCSQGVFIRDSLYWLFHDEHMTRYCTSFLAFDLKTDELHLLSLPNNLRDFSCFEMNIQAIEGCLSISIFREDLCFEVWVMDDNETEGSWTKLISIHDPNIFSYSRLYPLQYRKDVGMLLVARTQGGCKKFVWHDFETKAVEEIQIHGLSEDLWSIVLFSESLVSLDADQL